MPSNFTAPEIRRLLELLESELASRGTAATMYVVGGAAIALSFDTNRSTKGIDATLVPEGAVLEAARAVAEAEHLPPDWINSDAAAWTPVLPKGALRAPNRAGLQVVVASPESLLAMKLVASRNRDIPDIKLLAEAIGLKDPVALANLVRDQYGDDQLEAVPGGYEDVLVWCRTLSSQLWP